MPDEHSPNYEEFEASAREVFGFLSIDGWLKSTGETELLIGQINF